MRLDRVSIDFESVTRLAASIIHEAYRSFQSCKTLLLLLLVSSESARPSDVAIGKQYRVTHSDRPRGLKQALQRCAGHLDVLYIHRLQLRQGPRYSGGHFKLLSIVGVAVVVAALGLWWGHRRDEPIPDRPSGTDYILQWSQRTTIESGLGTVTGLSNGRVHAFLGLRYEQPPTGDRRFLAPVAAGSEVTI